MNIINKKKSKYLFLSSYTIPDTSGSGIHAFRYARYMNINGDSASILTFNRNLRMKSFETIESVPISRIPYFNKNIFFKLVSLPIIFCYYLLYVIRSNVVIIYGNKIPVFEAAIILCKIQRKKVIFQSLLYKVDDPYTLILHRGIIGKHFYRLLFRYIDCYYSINHEFTSQFKEIYGNTSKILELPQGVDTSVFYPISLEEKQIMRKQLNLAPDTFLIISAGFLIPRKKYEEVFVQLNKMSFNFTYVILGEYKVGSDHFLKKEYNNMRKLYTRGVSILGNKIVFCGFQNHIEQFLRCADAFLLNSEQEGLPNVLLEAMSCGIPVVCRNIRGVNDFITKNGMNAYIFENATEIEGVLQTLFLNKKESRKVAHSARQFIEDNCSFDRVSLLLKEKIKE